MPKPERYVVVADLHYPDVHQPTWDALWKFLEDDPPQGFVFLGDQFDNHSISHWTNGKPGQRFKRAFVDEERGFDREILKPLDGLLGKKCKKVWVVGNHDDRERELDDLYPELEGCFDRPTNLNLNERGWSVFKLGETFKYGKLYYVHGEALGGQYHSRKAVDLFCRNLVYGHLHSPQSFTKILPQDESQKWTAQCLPILGKTNPDYLEGRPHAWVNGFGVVEYHGEGLFNLYPVVVSRGRFSYGGRIFGG